MFLKIASIFGASAQLSSGKRSLSSSQRCSEVLCFATAPAARPAQQSREQILEITEPLLNGASNQVCLFAVESRRGWNRTGGLDLLCTGNLEMLSV